MKKTILSVLSLLFLFSCNLGDDLPRIENIKKGNKWTLKIGSTPAEVFAQLQELNKKEKIASVEIVGRKPFSTPEEIKDKIDLYDYLYFENSKWRASLYFQDGKVKSISAGETSTPPVTQWPQNVSDETAIQIDEPTDRIYGKLLKIYMLPEYKGTQIPLFQKTLELPFDPDMTNYDRWHFTFFTEIDFGKNGRSTVDLIFENGKLNLIKHTYEEFEVYNELPRGKPRSIRLVE